MAYRGRQNADLPLATALASGSTIRDAAAAVGVGERTATRRWADPDFRRRVSTIRGEMLDRTVALLNTVMAEVPDVLKTLLSAESETVRLGVCRCLLELTTRLRESTEFEQRLQALENRNGGDSRVHLKQVG